MIATIRTKNYDVMESFYRDTLRLHTIQGDLGRAIWFNDFGIEIHLEEVQSADEAGVTRPLILHSSQFEIVSAGLKERSIQMQTETDSEIRFRDPDGNILLLRKIQA